MKRFWLHIIFSIAFLGIVSEVFADVEGCERIEYGSRAAKVVPKVPNTIQRVSRSQAEKVADAVKAIEMKPITTKAGDIKGYNIKFGNPKNPKTIRLMNAGSGIRKDAAYFRISKDQYGAYDALGKFSNVQDQTHFNINPNTLLRDIENIVKNLSE